MGRKIQAVRLDSKRGYVRVRALSKSLRGTSYTLRSGEYFTLPKNRVTRYAQLLEQIEALVAE